MAGVVVGMGHPRAGSPSVRWATAEAAARGLPLTLVHAWRESVDVSVELPADSFPGLLTPAVSAALHGPVALVLCDLQPDLLVLGHHAGARPFGGPARACLRRASCPVVVVPDIDRPAVGRILVGSSLSQASRDALLWAAGEAALHGAELVVVHAWQVRPTSGRDMLHPAQAARSQSTSATEHLRSWVRGVLQRTGVGVRVERGAPLDVLLDLSEGADLIVLGRSTHSGLGRFLRTAVSVDLPGLASCPVALVPHQRLAGTRRETAR